VTDRSNTRQMAGKWRSPTWAMVRLLWRVAVERLRSAWRRLAHIADVGPGDCPHGTPMVDACPECDR
jgi:hypothetical protein